MNRRDVLTHSAMLAAVASAPRVVHAAAPGPTPRQTPGPFYPDRLPLHRDNNLLRRAPDDAPARGTPADVAGRVLDADGRPLSGLTVEIWQCDAKGYYHHIKEYSGGDPMFQGFGRTETAEDGAYRFRTIKPVPYSGRAPHIHVRVRGKGIEGFTTQLYIAGHRLNAQDFILGRVPPDMRERVMASFERESPGGPAKAQFDIVLDQNLPEL